MFVKNEIDNFDAVTAMAWSGAIQVCQEIIKQGREIEAMCIIENVFLEDIPTETQLNDFIWFELGDIMQLWDDDITE